MQRDILIFPKFKNMNLIQEVRNDYDQLAHLVEPHITLVFPFTDDISTEDLSNSIQRVVNNFPPFKVKFKGLGLTEDNYILLLCQEGNEMIIELHDRLYMEIFGSIPKREYIPHVTLGQSYSLEEFEYFEEYEFEDILDEITIEGIGIHEESIILDRIKLED